jgi:hypothetical protein
MFPSFGLLGELTTAEWLFTAGRRCGTVALRLELIIQFNLNNKLMKRINSKSDCVGSR